MFEVEAIDARHSFEQMGNTFGRDASNFSSLLAVLLLHILWFRFNVHWMAFDRVDMFSCGTAE